MKAEICGSIPLCATEDQCKIEVCQLIRYFAAERANGETSVPPITGQSEAEQGSPKTERCWLLA